MKRFSFKNKMRIKTSVVLLLSLLLCCGPVPELYAADSGDSCGAVCVASARSGWVIDGSKAKYYDPKTHKACKNGKYDIGGKTVLFDRNGYALNYASVGRGQMFGSIREAVRFLIGKNPRIAESPVNKTSAYVDIYEGTYKEGVDLQKLAGKGRSASGICFTGIGDVTWKSSAAYPTGCLCGYGAVTVDNIHFIARSAGTRPAYAFHYEAGDISFPSSNPGVIFRNCSFRAAGNFAVGIGMGRKYSRVTFRNCVFQGGKGDVYLHNSVYDGAARNRLTFVRCTAGQVYIFDAAKWDNDNTSKLTLRFVKNDFKRMRMDCGTRGKYAGKFFGFIPKACTNFEIVSSSGNSNIVFDRKGK